LKTTPEKLESELARTLAPVYLISGDEPLTAGEAADALRAAARAQAFARVGLRRGTDSGTAEGE